MKNKSRKPNIIFLSIDALRSKNLSCYGYKRNTTPNIDIQAKEGVLFEKFFSSHNSSNKSFLSILGGRHILGQDLEPYPSKREVQSFFDTGGILFPEILQKQGYKTFFLRKLFGWQKIGFDYYLKQDSQESSKKWDLIRSIKKVPLIYNLFKYLLHHSSIVPKRLENKIRSNNSGETTTNKAIEIIKQNKENSFFLWIHYTDTHVPHIFPYSFNKKFIPDKKGKKIFEILESKDGYSEKDITFLKGCWKSGDTVEDIIAKYDTAISYDDYLIREIIDILKKENLFENTIIFLFADHGESLGEHELYFTHEGLYDVSLHIPLVIVGKGIPKNKKIKALAQLEDLAPTILDLIGIKYDYLLFDGKSLLPLIFQEKKEIGKSIFMEEHSAGLKRRGIRTNRHKYVESPEKQYSICKLCNTTHGPTIGLYDLENDPDENINLAKTNKKLLFEMKSKLDKTLKDMKTLNEKRRIRNIINKKQINLNIKLQDE